MDLCGQSLRSMYVMHRSACNESACCSDIHDRCHFSAFLLNFKLLTHTTNKESQTLGTLLRHQLPSSLMQASAALKGILAFAFVNHLILLSLLTGKKWPLLKPQTGMSSMSNTDMERKEREHRSSDWSHRVTESQALCVCVWRERILLSRCWYVS